MSNLQIGLIILGLVLVLVVMGFNWWQDWRIRAQMHRHFPESGDDVLLGGEAAAERHEPVLGGASEEPAEIDARCEAVIDMVFVQPVDAHALTEALQPLLQTAAKPVRVFAVRDEDQACLSMQLAVLLTNRSGALSAIDWSRIWTQVQSLAAQFDCVVDGPEQDQVVQAAAQLDALCAELDATVNLQLPLAQAQPVADLQRQALTLGFVMRAQQCVWVDENDHVRFTLVCHGATWDAHVSVGRLDLILDVPNTPADSQAFSRMAGVGRELAAQVQADVCDDQGRPLSAEAQPLVDEQLAQLYQRLEAAGFVPGDARCARLFA